MTSGSPVPPDAVPYPTAPTLEVSRLVVLRHGRTEWNATGRFQGQLDPPLDAVGRRQALDTAPFVTAGLDPATTVVVSSDLARAADTAAPVAALLGVPVRWEPRLREHGLGTWEGLTRDEVAVRFPEQYAAWTASRPVSGRGGEDPAEVAGRAMAALAELSGEAAVVVTHGGTGLRLLEALLGLHTDQRRLLGPFGNCHWSELVAREGRWRLVRHNTAAPLAAAGHVPVEATASALDGRAPGDAPVAPAQDADVLA